MYKLYKANMKILYYGIPPNLETAVAAAAGGRFWPWRVGWRWRAQKRGVGTLWDCVSHVCGGGGGCIGGGVPLGAVPVLSWCGEVSLGGIQSSSSREGGSLPY